MYLFKSPLPGGQRRRRRGGRLPRVHARPHQPAGRQQRPRRRPARPPVAGDGRGLERLVRDGLPRRAGLRHRHRPPGERGRRVRHQQHGHRHPRRTRSTARSAPPPPPARAPRSPAPGGLLRRHRPHRRQRRPAQLRGPRRRRDLGGDAVGPARRRRRDRRPRPHHRGDAPVAQARRSSTCATRSCWPTRIAGGTHHAQIWRCSPPAAWATARDPSANATRATAAFDLPPVVAAGAPDAKSAALEQDTVLHVPIVNPGTTPLTGVHATLSATTPGVTVPAGTATVGTIGASATATATFAIRVAASRWVRVDRGPLARDRHQPGATNGPAERAHRHRQRDGRNTHLRDTGSRSPTTSPTAG